MGLFDFAASIGKKLFGDEAEAGDKIREDIEKDNPGVDGLKVEVNDGVAALSGTAKDQAAMEKAVLMAGNVKGIKEVNAGGLNTPEPTEKVEYYEIQKGDSLWKIAANFYGNGAKCTAIFEANQEVIKHPDKIYPGKRSESR